MRHDNEMINAAFDPAGGSFKSIDSETYLIHAGVCFDVSSVGNVVANSGTLVFTGEPGALPVHFHDLSITSTSGPVLLELIEEPTISAAGSAVTPYNRNRVSTNTALMSVKGGATITGGTVISARKINESGSGAHDQGGTGVFGGEWVLPTDSTYAVRVTNISGGEVTIDANFYFYELALS